MVRHRQHFWQTFASTQYYHIIMIMDIHVVCTNLRLKKNIFFWINFLIFDAHLPHFIGNYVNLKLILYVFPEHGIRPYVRRQQ
jgi:hypothetical protein